MNFVSIETPAPRVALAREVPEFGHAALGDVSASQSLQVFADQLIQAFAQGIGPLACAFDELLVERQRYVHAHRICVHVLCVKLTAMRAGA